MKMIDVREGKKAVERRVNGGGYGIVAEGGDGVHGDHVVFVIDTFIAALEREELFLIESGEAGALDAAEIAAGALDPEDLNGLAGEGIGLSDFGAGVAAGKVSEAQVGAEEIGAVAEELGLVQSCGYVGVPTVFEELEGDGSEDCLGHRHHFTKDGLRDGLMIHLKAIGNLFLGWILRVHL